MFLSVDVFIWTCPWTLKWQAWTLSLVSKKSGTFVSPQRLFIKQSIEVKACRLKRVNTPDQEDGEFFKNKTVQCLTHKREKRDCEAFSWRWMSRAELNMTACNDFPLYVFSLCYRRAEYEPDVNLLTSTIIMRWSMMCLTHTVLKHKKLMFLSMEHKRTFVSCVDLSKQWHLLQTFPENIVSWKKIISQKHVKEIHLITGDENYFISVQKKNTQIASVMSFSLLSDFHNNLSNKNPIILRFTIHLMHSVPSLQSEWIISPVKTSWTQQEHEMKRLEDQNPNHDTITTLFSSLDEFHLYSCHSNSPANEKHYKSFPYSHIQHKQY